MVGCAGGWACCSVRRGWWVPALVLLGGLGMPEAIGTSLVILALKSGAGFLGHAAHMQISWNLVAGFTAVTVVGSLIGTALSAKIPATRLRRGFGVFVLVMAVLVLGRELAVVPLSGTNGLVESVEE